MIKQEKHCIICNDLFIINCPTHKKCLKCKKISTPIHLRKDINRSYNKVCEHCNNQYFAKEYKSKTCYTCNEKILTQCPCGCEKKFMRSRMMIDKNPYWVNHNNRGKTYIEIYGTKTPGCGFKKDLENPNFTCLRSKNFSTLKCLNSIGQRFRSKLEVSFSEYCIKNNIPYINEVIVNLIDGKRKIVDFVIYDNIIVEISGFASPEWKKTFIEKMKVLRQSTINPILILTYNNNIYLDSEIYECCNCNVLVGSIQDLDKTIRTIKFLKNILYLNSMVFPNYFESIKLDYNSYKYKQILKYEQMDYC